MDTSATSAPVPLTRDGTKSVSCGCDNVSILFSPGIARHASLDSAPRALECSLVFVHRFRAHVVVQSVVTRWTRLFIPWVRRVYQPTTNLSSVPQFLNGPAGERPGGDLPDGFVHLAHRAHPGAASSQGQPEATGYVWTENERDGRTAFLRWIRR